MPCDVRTLYRLWFNSGTRCPLRASTAHAEVAIDGRHLSACFLREASAHPRSHEFPCQSRSGWNSQDARRPHVASQPSIGGAPIAGGAPCNRRDCFGSTRCFALGEKMASPPIGNALDVPTRSTPILTAAEISRVRPFGKLRQVEKGEILYEPGDTNVPFFILVSGS